MTQLFQSDVYKAILPLSLFDVVRFASGWANWIKWDACAESTEPHRFVRRHAELQLQVSKICIFLCSYGNLFCCWMSKAKKMGFVCWIYRPTSICENWMAATQTQVSKICKRILYVQAGCQQKPKMPESMLKAFSISHSMFCNLLLIWNAIFSQKLPTFPFSKTTGGQFISHLSPNKSPVTAEQQVLNY